jgi:branched-chain amino acid aminotransferase
VFTDHMLLAEHAAGEGWGRPALRPFGPLQLHPAAQVLHYGMACFEGMKAYMGPDGRPRLFRPAMNAARLRRAAARLQLADFEPEELLACIRELLRVDAPWLPSREGHSLYLRPFMFSSARALGVAKATRTTLSVVMSPVGPYFPSGLKPIALFVDEVHCRAWPGGVGDVKVGGNYAPTIRPQVEAAAAHGAAQVLYTRAATAAAAAAAAGAGGGAGGVDPDDAEVAECGAMNIFFLLDRVGGGGRELVTPPLDGTILPGVTRDSILGLARAWGEFEVSERRLSVGEVARAAAEGRLVEAFGCGTACVVQPVGALLRAQGQVYVPKVSDPGHPGALAPRLQRALLDIQYGRVEHPWSEVVE